jgi:hypothetical protein
VDADGRTAARPTAARPFSPPASNSKWRATRCPISGRCRDALGEQFWRKLNADPGALRSAALKALFGAGRIVRGEFLAFLPQGSVSCDLRSGAYRMSVAGETFGGVGVLALARDAFGVSEATAARRLLEALGGFRMPGERALALETAIGAALDEGPR